MSTNRKARSDSRLKTLPEERQAAIAEYARDHSLQDTLKWLRADGLQTSLSALSQFLSWWQLQQQLMANESTVADVLEDLKHNDPAMTQSQLEQAGQAFFSALAIQQQDSLTWKRVQDSKLRLGVLKLNREKFEFDAAAECLKKLPELQAISNRPKLSPDEKTKAIQQILFPK